MKYFLSAVILLFFMTDNVRAAETSDTLTARFHYRVDSFEIDSSYRGNALAIDRIRHFIEESSEITGIVIYSCASPEGRIRSNVHLSEMRGIAVKNIITDSLAGTCSLPADMIRLCPDMDNRDALKDAVIRRYHRSNRSAILAVLDREEPSCLKEKRLRKDRRSWNFIADEILPDLRYAEVVCIGKFRPVGTLSAILPPPSLCICL